MTSLNISDIRFSHTDIKRGLKLPVKLTEDLAEDIGIMVGDGYVYYGKRASNKKTDYTIGIAGHLITDKAYIQNHIYNLKKRLFGVKFQLLENRIFQFGLVNVYLNPVPSHNRGLRSIDFSGLHWDIKKLLIEFPEHIIKHSVKNFCASM